MITVTAQQVIDAIPALNQFAQKELPAKAAYRVSKMVKKLNSESRDIQEQRNKLIVKHGEVFLENGQESTRVKPESMEAFLAEVKDLLSVEVNLEGLAKIAFQDIESLKLSPAVLSDLDAFIDAPVET